MPFSNIIVWALSGFSQSFIKKNKVIFSSLAQELNVNFDISVSNEISWYIFHTFLFSECASFFFVCVFWPVQGQDLAYYVNRMVPFLWSKDLFLTLMFLFHTVVIQVMIKSYSLRLGSVAETFLCTPSEITKSSHTFNYLHLLAENWLRWNHWIFCQRGPLWCVQWWWQILQDSQGWLQSHQRNGWVRSSVT